MRGATRLLELGWEDWGERQLHPQPPPQHPPPLRVPELAIAWAAAATPLPLWLRAANVDISRVTAELSQCGHRASLSVARINASKERSQLAHRYS
jgi:hypothetical protein